MRIRVVNLLAILLLLGLLFLPLARVVAQNISVKAILFYSPSCGHCEKVINEDLPGILERFTGDLQIALVNVSTQDGTNLYQEAIETFNIPDQRLGVPTLILDQVVLVGSREIPDQLPSLVEQRLAGNGSDWPTIDGFSQLVNQVQILGEANPQEIQPTVRPAFINQFMRDPLGNSIATLVLIGMIISLVMVGIYFVKGDPSSLKEWPVWTIPVLSVIGLGTALYLTFVETSNANAFCGPVGDCNAVQKSPYAMLFGFLPVGLLGAIGYISLISLWIYQRLNNRKPFAWILIWAFSIFGVIFSIYLTFLEPFVIGATCMWCITSAVVMTLIMWASTPPAIRALNVEETRVSKPKILQGD